MQHGKIGWRERIGWASGDTGLNFYWQTISGFLYFFYTDVMGISPFWAGVAFGVGSLWDAVCDPIVGAIADRTRSRYGRFRPYLLYLSVPCALTFVLAFTVPPLEGGWLVAYAMVTHAILRTFTTAIGIAYGALSARLATDSNERGTLSSMRMIAAACGSLGVSITLPKLLSTYEDPKIAYLFATTLLGIMATIILLICFATTRETVDPALDDEIPPARGFGQVLLRLGRDMLAFWGMLKHNVPLRQLFLAIVVSSIIVTMFGKCAIYWYKYDLQNLGVMSLTASAPVIPFLIAAPLWAWYSRRTSKRAVWIIGHLIASACYLAFYFLNPRDLTTLLVLVCTMGFAGAAGSVMFWAMLPDTVEYNEWKIGERAEARIFGFAMLAQKGALAINAIILGQTLEWIGFAPGQVQTRDTLDALLVLMCLVPFAGGIVTTLIMWRYPLDAKRHGEIIEEIRLRTAAAPKR